MMDVTIKETGKRRRDCILKSEIMQFVPSATVLSQFTRMEEGTNPELNFKIAIYGHILTAPMGIVIIMFEIFEIK